MNATSRKLATVALLVLLFGVALFTTGGCGGLPTEIDFNFGRLTGRVTDAATGAPIAGARVTMQNFPVTSNADGFYEITALSEGRHTLTVTATGYADYRADVNIREGDQTHHVSMRRP